MSMHMHIHMYMQTVQYIHSNLYKNKNNNIKQEVFEKNLS